MVDTPGKVTLWGIEVFAAAVEEGSISAAARRLGVSPSSVSQQLSNLEAALGATLLDRGGRPLMVTPAGQLFRARAQAILNEAAEARAELAMRDLARLSRFNLGVIEDFDADVTPALLSGLADDLPATRFLLETGASHRLYDLLEARTLDVIVAADLGPAAEWMEVHPLFEEPFVAAVPKGAVAEGADLLATLQALPLIQYTARHYMGRQIAGHLSRQNLTLSHRFELDSYHAIMAMVAEGAGWTILTPLGFLRAGRFRDRADVLPLPFAPLSRTISLTARREVLLDLPGRVAGRLRPLLADLIVRPALGRMPWLGDSFRVL
ncbi:LysR family transcriptional regulator [Palleronia sp. KMU-117]|uniref:LysR family transcriptional regulator n=1 Tax=Palleronia sp. KMU-117 TaxID=3434108 RepID=UPI003D730229